MVQFLRSEIRKILKRLFWNNEHATAIVVAIHAPNLVFGQQSTILSALELIKDHHENKNNTFSITTRLVVCV